MLAFSPAINAGTASGAPATDQRGQARVGTPDIGAYETGFETPTDITLTNATVPETAPIGTVVTMRPLW